MEELRLPEWMKKGRGFLNGERGFAWEPGKRIKEGIIEKNLLKISEFLKDFIYPHRKDAGLLQMLDARARIAGIFAIVFGAAFVENLVSIVLFIFLTVLTALFSSIGLPELFKRTYVPLVFASIISAPILVLTPGVEYFSLSLLGVKLAFTLEGLNIAGVFLARATVMAGLVGLMFLATKEMELFKGLKGIGVPRFFITAFFMTFRYVFIFLKLIENSVMARKSRLITPRIIKDSHRWFAARGAFIFERALNISGEVAMSLTSRGFNGTVVSFDKARLKGRDYLWLGFAFFVFFLSIGVWQG